MRPTPAPASPRRSLAVAVLLALAGCGYAVTTAGHGLHGGAARASVRPFENLSAEPELGAVVTAAVREQLARRGEDGDGSAVIEGEVRSGEAVPSMPSGGPAGSPATWRVAVEVRARLRVGDKVVAEKTIRREYDYLTGGDPLETEGRRAIAFRRLAALAAEDLVRAFEG